MTRKKLFSCCQSSDKAQIFVAVILLVGFSFVFFSVRFSFLLRFFLDVWPVVLYIIYYCNLCMIYYSCNIASSPPSGPYQPTRVSCLLPALWLNFSLFSSPPFFFGTSFQSLQRIFWNFWAFCPRTLEHHNLGCCPNRPSVAVINNLSDLCFFGLENRWILFLSIFWLLLPIILMKRSTIINYSGSELWPTSRAPPSARQTASNMMILKPIVYVWACCLNTHISNIKYCLVSSSAALFVRHHSVPY